MFITITLIAVSNEPATTWSTGKCELLDHTYNNNTAQHLVSPQWKKHNTFSMTNKIKHSNLISTTEPQPPHHNRFTALFLKHPGEPAPEENFCTLWWKGRLTEADTLTIRLGATPSGLTSAHLHHPPIFYRPETLPATQPTVSKHWRQLAQQPQKYTINLG